ncbi:MAG: hypothetical protein FWE36_06135 [Erysipelotrichales bacterium]|nr:hypothetical protein [Erysipelotrichales bacterium]
MTENTKSMIIDNNKKYFKYLKKDLIFSKILYIDNINNQEGCWWHISACYLNFFESCESLYDLLSMIKDIMPDFQFTVFQQKPSLMNFTFFEFIQHIYEIVGSSKKRFEARFGKLSVIPNAPFYKFKRKNQKYFIKSDE